jgi:tetraacyldisaccharide 4'-kinase
VNPDRVAGAAEAVGRGADVLVMDDGFQHLRLRRDLDIVLVDASNPFGFGHCLPRGLLREPLSALRSAGAVVITHCEMVGRDELAGLRARLAMLAGRAGVCLAEHQPATIECNGQTMPASELAGRKVFAFCGIGNPENFFAMLQRAGAEIVGQAAFADHVDYSGSTLNGLAERAQASKADVLVTTAKDRVKLADPGQLPLPLWTLGMKFSVVEGEAELLKAIAGVV